MSTDLAVRAQPAQLTVLSNDQLSYIASTEFVPPGLRGNLPAILACVATGRALGIPDMIALRCIHIIDGKPSFSAELMVAQVRERGHSITGDVTDTAATVTGTRLDNGDTMTYTFTLAMAERAGLANKQNWKRYPEAMCWARAVSQMCRMLFADVFAGATYVPDEVEDGDFTDSAGEPQAERAGLLVSQTGSVDEPESASPADEAFVETFGEAATKEPPARKIKDADKQLEKDEPMWRKLNVLVGRLRKAEVITTRRIWVTVAIMRVRAADDLILELGGIGEDGELHWSPLRDSLTKAEAHALIDKLEQLDASVKDGSYFEQRAAAVRAKADA